jgi:membrane protein DedA with SNARE-associated domain
MNFKMYSLSTVLGSGIWCSILCWLGIKMGQDEQLKQGEYHHVLAWLAIILLILGGLYYFFVHRQMKKITPPS